ncbi:5-bromo-4-chloroindolyl phosphate hydrolysis family protein [Litorisediminicola beolgyonensis]|uniref:5-bromo-4-chloroindolyl phosphate hydrolysis family protein n=1 Tax=Litorisediminicola beolgyonensis TaxID=1173614 RepID=A0ABW3ZF20_9RHOB
MARRYGGSYSPDPAARPEPGAPPAYANAPINQVGARANLMVVPPILLALFSLGSGAAGLLFGLMGAGLWLGGAWMLREGLKAEAAFAERKIARPPALPRKILAALLCAGGAGLATLSNEGGVVAATLFAIVAGGLHLGAFGVDPMRGKGLESVDAFQQDRVAKVVDEAEAYLADMARAVETIRDRAVTDRVARFRMTAQELIRTVEDDPRDLTAARRYLGVYLMGARDAARKFSDIQARRDDETAKADFIKLLDDLETSYGSKTQALLTDSNSDLKVEIDVLRDRLQREGVRLDRSAT